MIEIGKAYYISYDNLRSAINNVLGVMDSDDLAALAENMLGGVCLSEEDGFIFTPNQDYDQDIDKYLETDY